MAKQIELTRGKFTLVDDGDYEYLSQFKWYATRSKHGPWYAARHAGKGDSRKRILMHRVILDAPDGMLVDHVNHNGLDNRRENLRLATRSQNALNSKKRIGSTSRFKGVYWIKRHSMWKAAVSVNGEREDLGYFKSEIEAAKAYDEAAKRLYGEFAVMNFD